MHVFVVLVLVDEVSDGQCAAEQTVYTCSRCGVCVRSSDFSLINSRERNVSLAAECSTLFSERVCLLFAAGQVEHRDFIRALI